MHVSLQVVLGMKYVLVIGFKSSDIIIYCVARPPYHNVIVELDTYM